MPILQENKVIELKYAAKQFGKMNEEELELSAYELLLKIHAVRGWTVPVSELMDILVKQFSLKMTEKYANVNAEEMMYAFRNTELEIKDWGKALNLSLIDEVMLPYLEQRFELSRTEENLLNKPIMIEDIKPLSKEEKAEWMMDWKMMGDDINFELIPLQFYDFMEEDNLLRVTPKRKWEYLERATKAIKSQLQIDIGNCKTTDALRLYGEFEKMEKEGFTGELKGRILNRAKRLIIYDYLKGIIQ